MEVSSSSFDTIRIRVKETEPIGAIYAGGRWVVVGEDGRGLEALPVESERPSRYLYIRGADPLAEELGTVMLDERSLAIVNELRAAFVSAGLDGVGMIDLTDKTDILLDWKNQITIALGNDANLTYEIQVAGRLTAHHPAGAGRDRPGESWISGCIPTPASPIRSSRSSPKPPERKAGKPAPPCPVESPL